ncbi:HemK2/MTQ2 family protein methyltransferase [Actinacidiphila acidipaludis]|uniref:Methyltransferase n=1 Tax=Actinacidiphila acidipaludis TaxID=2873382 RepID=A0ABS7QIQ4_9ACTN|nr:HemK2/MTQ2 family protein methyltransferase [Streptomyces acidipaludis]MBY8883057.1 methyltransferase [Streptomyces acidipaludis]
MPALTAPALSGAGRLWTIPGVYAPQADSHLLARALETEGVRAGMRVLDIGTGSGALAVQAARMGAEVYATDISRRAVVTAWANAARHGRRIRVRRCDPARPWSGSALDLPSRAFDLVVSNPPYVPTPPGSTRGAARAWNAGHDGRRMVDRLADHAPSLLRRGGVMLVVHSELCGVEPTLRRFAQSGCRPQVVARADVPFGPVLTARLPWLRARGLVADGQEHEGLVVVRAQRL